MRWAIHIDGEIIAYDLQSDFLIECLLFGDFILRPLTMHFFLCDHFNVIIVIESDDLLWNFLNIYWYGKIRRKSRFFFILIETDTKKNCFMF